MSRVIYIIKESVSNVAPCIRCIQKVGITWLPACGNWPIGAASCLEVGIISLKKSRYFPNTSDALLCYVRLTQPLVDGLKRVRIQHVYVTGYIGLTEVHSDLYGSLLVLMIYSCTKHNSTVFSQYSDHILTILVQKFRSKCTYWAAPPLDCPWGRTHCSQLLEGQLTEGCHSNEGLQQWAWVRSHILQWKWWNKNCWQKPVS